MKTSLITAPYHLGMENVGVGAGPRHLIGAGLVDELRRDGFDVRVDKARRKTPYSNAMQAMTDVHATVADLVQRALDAGDFPLILGGNCASSLAALARLDTAGLGVVWFDTHGDFNTPDTSPSGFLDGMALAVATGRCMPDVWQRMGGKALLADGHILMAGVRDVDPGERMIFAATDVQVAWAEHFDEFDAKLSALQERTKDAYIHVDIDAVDPSEMPATDFRTSGGLSAGQLSHAIDAIGAGFTVRGATIASFSPAADEDGKSVRIIFETVKQIARIAAQART